jgi:predicted alpha/beta-fold hydrolase
MQEKVFFLDSKGIKVSAILTTPQKTHAPIVIMCHGLNSGKDSTTNLALEKIFLNNKIRNSCGSL